jgi:hypothetical protein
MRGEKKIKEPLKDWRMKRQLVCYPFLHRHQPLQMMKMIFDDQTIVIPYQPWHGMASIAYCNWSFGDGEKKERAWMWSTCR